MSRAKANALAEYVVETIHLARDIATQTNCFSLQSSNTCSTEQNEF